MAAEHVADTEVRRVAQYTEALDRANDVRAKRAEMKRKLNARQVSVMSILTDPPYYAETMLLIDLFVALPFVGRAKATKFLTESLVSPSLTVGGLSNRQRDRLCKELLSHHSSWTAKQGGRRK